jgi:hypothetical protein
MSNAPFVKVIIGSGFDNIADLYNDEGEVNNNFTPGENRNFTFTWGDGKLRDVTVTLAENENLSSCSFSVFDEDGSIINSFAEYIKEIEGLEPVNIKRETAQETASSSSTIGVSGDAPPAGTYGGTYLNAEQTKNAFTIAKVGASLGATRWDIEVALMTALQESTLRNLNYGDRDSQGLFQQRPSAGWGSVAEITNPEYSAGAFFNGAGANKGLLDYPNRQTQFTKGQAAQKVQISAFPDAYDKWEDEASALVDAMDLSTPSEVDEETASQKDAENSTSPVAASSPGRSVTLAGQQITIFLGFNMIPLVAYSFIHTGLTWNLYPDSTVQFTGSAAAWVMNVSKKNTAYVNISLKELAEKLASKYGLEVVMNIEGPRYVYIQQKALSDWEFLLRECNRVGLIIKNVGSNKIEILEREETLEGTTEEEVFTIEKGVNINSFSLSHNTSSEQGGRSSEPGKRHNSGVKKNYLNPETGMIENVEEEISVGDGQDTSIQNTSGSVFDENSPLTSGLTDLEDARRLDREQRVKGIVANYSIPASAESLLISPDTAIRTINLGSFISRIWVNDTVIQELGQDGKFTTKGTIYTPLKKQVSNGERNYQ